MRSIGTVRTLRRDGRFVYEAIYTPSYRHNARRLDYSAECVGWPTRESAVRALQDVAMRDGTTLDLAFESPLQCNE